MRREVVLAGGIAVLMLATAITTGVVPGVLESPTKDDRPGRLTIHEVTISPGEVTGSTATLSVTSHLRHHGGETENISIRVRAVALGSGLLETIEETSVDPISGDREVEQTTNITVSRSGGYRIEAILFVDGERRHTTAKQVTGIESLTPAYADTSVEFQGFGATDPGALPSLQYSIVDTADNYTTLRISAYLTNRGDTVTSNHQVEFILRQAESDIIANRTTVTVPQIEPGTTATPNATIRVPANYNYYIDAILWRDEVILSSTRAAANLNPTERIPMNTTVRSVGLQVSDFEQPRKTPPRATRQPQATAAPGQPGFTPVVALIALLLTTIVAWRRYHE